MIPHTPLLLVSAANAVARHADRMRRERRAIDCSLEFVQAIGATSHSDLQGAVTSWPLGFVTSLEMLRAVAKRREQVRDRVLAGDLLVFPWPRELAHAWVTAPVASPAARQGSPPAQPEGVGIVLEVHDHHEMSDGCLSRCLIATARSVAHDAMAVETFDYWCDTRDRDLAIRWYATADDIEKAA